MDSWEVLYHKVAKAEPNADAAGGGISSTRGGALVKIKDEDEEGRGWGQLLVAEARTLGGLVVEYWNVRVPELCNA